MEPRQYVSNGQDRLLVACNSVERDRGWPLVARMPTGPLVRGAAGMPLGGVDDLRESD